MTGLQDVYSHHHATKKWVGKKVILSKERGEFLRKHIGKGKNILDVGCRDGGLTETYSEGNTVLAVDVDEQELAKIHLPGVTTRALDLNGEWSLPERSFDVVVAAEVLEHLFYPGIVIQKIGAVLKEDGMLIGTLPNGLNLVTRLKLLLGTKRNTSLDDPTHISHFFWNEFRNLLSASFTSVELLPWVSPRYKLFSFIPRAVADKIFFVAKGVKR